MATAPPGSVNALLATATERLRAGGVESPHLDAERLLRHVMGWDRGAVLIRGREPLAPASLPEFLRLVEARAARQPLQHLVESQAFWRHDFLVTKDVLVPRPETELLVEASLDLLTDTPRPVIVDVGTGSGCIALSLAAELAEADVHATDVSAPALTVARTNAARLGLQHRVRFHEADLLAPWVGQPPAFDLVASNPPYVDARDVPGLDPEVRDHEPRLALVAPGETLSVYRALTPQAHAVLHPGGHLVLEIGKGQQASVSEILVAAGFLVERIVHDMQSIPRTLVCRKA